MSDPHRHDHVRIRGDYVDPHGRPVDHELLGRLVSSLLDGCELCSELALIVLAEDALTIVRLIELAYISVLQRDGNPLAGGSGRLSLPAELRALFEVGASRGSGDLLVQCQEMASAQRRSAAMSAVSVMLRQLAV